MVATGIECSVGHVTSRLSCSFCDTADLADNQHKGSIVCIWFNVSKEISV